MAKGSLASPQTLLRKCGNASDRVQGFLTVILHSMLDSAEELALEESLSNMSQLDPSCAASRTYMHVCTQRPVAEGVPLSASAHCVTGVSPFGCVRFDGLVPTCAL